jgi:acetylglutamate kinase
MDKQPLKIIKIGGNIISDEKRLLEFLVDFASLKDQKILVHGGGKLATQLASRLGVASKMVNGRRITDKKNLEIITMVYGGLVNKNIVASLQKFGCNALGLSGADANIIKAHKRIVKDTDYGFAGDIDEVNVATLSTLLKSKITPVICPVTHDQNGQLLNTNADTMAAEIAIALSKRYETQLFYCFEKNGVLRDVNNDDSVIKTINSTLYKELLQDGIITDGMLPKLQNCFHALEHQVKKVFLGNEKMIREEKPTATKLSL